MEVKNTDVHQFGSFNEPYTNRSATEKRSRGTFKAQDTVAEMAKRYKNVSLFSWYTPKGFRPKRKSKGGAAQQQIPGKITGNFLSQEPYCPS